MRKGEEEKGITPGSSLLRLEGREKGGYVEKWVEKKRRKERGREDSTKRKLPPTTSGHPRLTFQSAGDFGVAGVSGRAGALGSVVP